MTVVFGSNTEAGGQVDKVIMPVDRIDSGAMAWLHG
jgi:hypothetical protein